MLTFLINVHANSLSDSLKIYARDLRV